MVVIGDKFLRGLWLYLAWGVLVGGLGGCLEPVEELGVGDSPFRLEAEGES